LIMMLGDLNDNSFLIHYVINLSISMLSSWESQEE
jgi:hypothetical protein